MNALASGVADFVQAHLPQGKVAVRADKILHDSVWGTVSLRKHEVALLDTALMQRLRQIHQTSFAYLTYPSAVHTRFEHSLGCLALAAQFVQHLRSKGGTAKSLITDDVEDNIRVAALLHDIGHGPFSHSSESVYSLLPDLAALRSPGQTYENVKPHETLSCLIVRSAPFREYLDRINIDYAKSLDADRIANAISGRCKSDRLFEAQILNGPFDVDKIDYVIRDGRLIGLPIALDLNRFFSAIDVSADSTTGERKLVIDLKGEVTLEQIVFGKMTLYNCVYQHHKARACDCMLAAVFEYARRKRVSLNGRSMKNPADFLWCTDDWLAADGGKFGAKHPVLHDLMHGMAYRRLLKRALAIAKDFVQVPSGTAGLDRRYNDLLELRMGKPEHHEPLRALAKRITERAGNCCSDHMVWVDLPRPPATKEGKETSVRMPDGSLCGLNKVFGLDQWAEHYDQHKWMGHVFAPEEHRQAISKAARAVLKEDYGIDLKPIAWQICHVAD